jgi:hypothetical protein
MGCLRSTGRERLLTEEGPPGSAGSSNVTEAAVAGDYAALAINSVNPKPPTGFSASNLLIFDLRTGAGVPNRGGEGPFCNVGFAARCEIDQLVLGADAVSAVHSTVRDNGCTCTVEQIQASDSTGEHTLDSVTQSDGSPPALTNLTLTGDTLTWQHNGQLPSAQLQP